MHAKRTARDPGRPAHDPQDSAADAAVPAGRWAWEFTKIVLIAITLFICLRSFFVEAFRIPTASMAPTLLVGDFLIASKARFGFRLPFTSLRTPPFGSPMRGEIVVFNPPHEPVQNYVKRVIGMPGDTVAMRDHIVYVNGRALTEPYAHRSVTDDVRAPAMKWQCRYTIVHDVTCAPSRDTWGPLVVPADQFLVLGDNRDDSEDSRYWGFVARSAIKGRPLVVYFSFDPAGPGRAPWLTEVRWARLGTALR